jgi:S1 RNA binding domain
MMWLQVNVPERLLVLSERAANMADLLRTVKRGDVVEGTVQKLTDYGAFVSINAADGTQHGTDVRPVQLSQTKSRLRPTVQPRGRSMPCLSHHGGMASLATSHPVFLVGIWLPGKMHRLSL